MKEILQFLAWLENKKEFIALCEIDDQVFHWREMYDEEVADLLKEYAVVLEDIPGPGRYEGNKSLLVSEHLADICGNGLHNEHFGSVDENVIWEALLITDWGMFPQERGAYADPLSEKLKAAYIVREDNQGFFTYEEFEKQEEAWNRYMAELAAYESYYTK